MSIDINMKMNAAYIPYLDKPQATQIFYGGSSSGKSYFIAQKIVADNMRGVNWLVCRNVARTIRTSIFNEINKCIIDAGLSEFYAINRSDMVITNKIANKQILFVGLDDPEKVKSITPINGVIERIFVEEATEIKRNALLQLKRRLRGGSPFKKYIILAFNPILRSHWIYKEFFGGWQDGKNSYEDDKLTILKTTYRDNAFLTRDDIALLEDETDPYFRSVYADGNWGILGHVIFKNWHIEDLSDRMDTFDRLRFGMDFGYAVDPNALIKLHIDKKRKKIYILDEYSQAGMSDEILLDVARDFVGDNVVTCDNSETKTIDFLSSHGINAYPSVKGPDSINRGIRFLQGYEIIVDVRCQNFKNEIEQYHWREDKYGEPMAQAVDKDNHLLDALRYAVEDDMFESEARAIRRVGR